MQITTQRNTDAFQLLNGLLRGEQAAVETYRLALDEIHEQPLRATFQECWQSHHNRVDLLKQRIARLGGQPAEASGTWGSFARLVENGARSRGIKPAITALEEGEDRLLADISRALADNRLSTDLRPFVEGQLWVPEVETHRQVANLIHGLH